MGRSVPCGHPGTQALSFSLLCHLIGRVSRTQHWPSVLDNFISCGRCPVCCGIISSVVGFYSKIPMASSSPSCDTQMCFQMLPTIPWGLSTTPGKSPRECPGLPGQSCGKRKGAKVQGKSSVCESWTCPCSYFHSNLWSTPSCKGGWQMSSLSLSLLCSREDFLGTTMGLLHQSHPILTAILGVGLTPPHFTHHPPEV